MCVHTTFWSGYVSINCKHWRVCVRVDLLITFPWTWLFLVVSHVFLSHYNVNRIVGLVSTVVLCRGCLGWQRRGHWYGLAGRGLRWHSLDGFIALTCSPDPQSAGPRAEAADLNWYQVDLDWCFLGWSSTSSPCFSKLCVHRLTDCTGYNGCLSCISFYFSFYAQRQTMQSFMLI